MQDFASEGQDVSCICMPSKKFPGSAAPPVGLVTFRTNRSETFSFGLPLGDALLAPAIRWVRIGYLSASPIKPVGYPRLKGIPHSQHTDSSSTIELADFLVRL
ncbi:hypothetical protein EYR41_005352 [Orbilia oligospora]|uniref:Uncharacterized protein n=1 Tax=Orbilia oligospora TaxID=2813651 RepID=A0A7C8KMK8_ORBOL|nr:hypothetical protein TWF751_007746 [Orbilia oligospora]KAF3283579.1 hypothetical protein TWF132_010028 [Orbilia oligospora]TGJ69300.1 hypothetical protein EYR41_005352 [Orbilia oligospora]